MRKPQRIFWSSSYQYRLTNTLCILVILLAVSACDLSLGGSTPAPTSTSSNCKSGSSPVRGRIFDRNGVLLADSNASGQRHYYEPSLAGLIGYYIGPQYDSTGIEHQYDDYLSGRKTTSQACPTRGDDIYLTIDVRIQNIVEHDFDTDVTPPDGVNVFPTNRGSVVVTDPHTGAILAMLSRPGFDPNRLAAGDMNYLHQLENDQDSPLLERPLYAQYVPGAMYNMMTLMAALDSGSATLNDPFYNDLQPGHPQAIGPVLINGEQFGPVGNNIVAYTAHYPVNLRYGFVHSDNIIFAQVGAKMGVNTWLNYNNRFYVGKQIPFDLPILKSTVTPASRQLSINGLAEDAFGQGIDSLTPMQMTLFDNAIADNGHLMRPVLVMKIVGPNQTILQSDNPQDLGTLISQDTASQLRDAMYGVTQCGPGFVIPTLRNSPWAIMSSTGTGEVGGGKSAESWLLTQAPYNNPAVTIVSMKENGGEGNYSNGPMVADMYKDIFTNIIHLQPAPAPDPTYCFKTGLLQS